MHKQITATITLLIIISIMSLPMLVTITGFHFIESSSDAPKDIQTKDIKEALKRLKQTVKELEDHLEKELADRQSASHQETK
jgi:hypothetical protein